MSLALPSTLSSPGKRRRSPADDCTDMDSENINPSILSSTKRTKNTDGISLKAQRPLFPVLRKANSGPVHGKHSVSAPKRLSQPKANEPAFPPTAVVVGRSPKSKRIGILSRKRISSSCMRVDPPFGLSGQGSGPPLSIDAALSGTIPSYKFKTSTPLPLILDDSIPRGWIFDIHEDTPAQELDNLVQHSTQTLDISDDECRSLRYDDRGKENIPPSLPSMPVPTQSERIATIIAEPVSRKNMMSDEPRTPLGDLDAREFYAVGCDAGSCITIPVEKDIVNDGRGVSTSEEGRQSPSPSDSAGANQDVWKELLAQVNAKSAADGTRDSALTGSETDEATITTGNRSPIEIWESESAKGEEHGP